MDAQVSGRDSDAETNAFLAGFAISALWVFLGILVPILNYLMLQFVTTYQLRETFSVALVRYTFLWGPWLLAAALSGILIRRFYQRTVSVKVVAAVLVSLVIVGAVELAVSLTPMLSLLRSLA